MRESKEDVPPNSRLFVLHGKNATKEELHEAFEKYGKVEDIWMVRDKESGEVKGVSYVKFSKMSEAAHAADEMNGTPLASNPRPLKVIIANSRDCREPTSKKDDDISRFLRLFIVIPKDDSETEDTLKEYFSTFGEVDSVNILRNRETSENKGFAYVKFNKMFHAAKALEECDQKYKPVLAKPKERRSDREPREPSGFNKPPRDRDYKYNAPAPSSRFGDLCEGYACDQGYTKVCAFISTRLTEDLAIRLFDLVPGLAFAKLNDEPISHRTQKMLLEYDTPEAAAFAVDRLSGFEYPIGEPMILKPEFGWKQGSGFGPKPSYNERKRTYEGNSYRPSAGEDSVAFSNYQKIANLTEALEEATSIIKAHGLSSGLAPKYCSAKLPPVQPMTKGEEVKHRLFIVCQPEAPPLAALKDVFCRFGNLVDIYVLPGKNYGYVSYSNSNSALQAIAVLHKEELYGNRMKVLEADPPRPDSKKPRQE